MSLFPVKLEALSDPDTRAGYDALEPEFALLALTSSLCLGG